jgi:uncharacterized repeat protein (TIGR03803 family)
MMSVLAVLRCFVMPTEGAGGSGGCELGCGTVFEVSPNVGGGWTEKVLLSFGSNNDGARPQAGLVMDAAGNLYGTTTLGGSGSSGTVFELDTNNNETVLYNFTGGADGAYPTAGLTQDAAGNLYGTTQSGGIGTCMFGNIPGCGVVFKLDTNNNETVLHSFTGGSDGGMPKGGLIEDAQSNFYGTTYEGGGAKCDCGVVFKLTP